MSWVNSARFSQIEPANLEEHSSLLIGDECYYILEYTSGRNYAFGTANSVINNLKKSPAAYRSRPDVWRYKLSAISECAQALEKSLKRTQDELEGFRSKYHEADKGQALQLSKNQTLALHEILKFLISAVIGGLGVNLISSGEYAKGSAMVVTALVVYAIIVWFDRKN